LFEHRVDPGQQRTVERVVVGQQVRARGYGLEHFEVLGLVLGVVVSRLQFGAGHRVRAVFHRVPATAENRVIYVRMEKENRFGRQDKYNNTVNGRVMFVWKIKYCSKRDFIART